MNDQPPTPRIPTPTYSLLVPTCAAYGIGRTKAFEYAKEGLLETFKLGSRTYVTLASLDALPERIRQERGA